MAFRVGLSRDLVTAEGEVGLGDIGLDRLDAAPGVEWAPLPGGTDEIAPEDLTGFDALLLFMPTLPGATVAAAEGLVHVARLGLGYDTVDVEACTEHGVLVTITPDATPRPLAVAALTLLLATTHRLREKDRLVREGRWYERGRHMGTGLTGRTLGVVGLGRVGRELVGLAAPLRMRVLAADPYVDPAAAAELGVELRELDVVLAQADVLVICAALTPETRGLIGAAQLARMKPSAHLVNVGRGPMVDQAALTDALRDGALAGAALDVLDPEPVDPADPLLTLPNVTLSPHALCWTDEWALHTGTSACEAVLAVAGGRMPAYPVNPAAAERGRLRGRLS